MTSPSHARDDEDASATHGESAAGRGHRGLQLFEEGATAEALAEFEAAESLSHSPVFVLYIARCQRKLGRLVAARRHLRAIVAEDHGPNPPPAFERAQREAREDLGALESVIPTLRIVAPAGAIIAVDGHTIAAADRDTLHVDPGSHELVARESNAPHARIVRLTVTVTVGEPRRTVPVSFAQTRAPVPSPEPPGASSGLWYPGLIVLGVGAASLGVAIGTGVAAQAAVDSFRARCAGTICFAEDQAAADDAAALADVSTALFIVGGAITLGGTALLIWRPGATTIAWGPTRITVAGRF